VVDGTHELMARAKRFEAEVVFEEIIVQIKQHITTDIILHEDINDTIRVCSHA
jgi:hypothetical protein